MPAPARPAFKGARIVPIAMTGALGNKFDALAAGIPVYYRPPQHPTSMRQSVAIVSYRGNRTDQMTAPLHPGVPVPAAAAVGALEKTALESYQAPARPSLIGLSRAGLSDALAALGVTPAKRRMRVQQLWHWIYVRGASSFDQMTSVSKELRAALEAHFTLARPELVAEQVSVDGTRKWLLRLAGGEAGRTAPEIECVYIPETDRGTLCLSSQIGCTLTCSFCHTGTQRLVRNLTPGEIVGQIMVARDRLGDWVGADRLRGSGKPLQGDRLVSNIVVMGMGEPLYNFEAVRDALLMAADGDGIAISKRRITLSTSGVVPNIARAGAEIGCMLAVSLHAVHDELRSQLVPLNRKYPIADLLAACRSYPGLSNARRITFEYVMLKGVNDELADAKALVALLKGIPAKINLIPFNPWPGTQYECSDWERIEAFSEIIFNAGYASPVRTPRGRDILAACGQLKSASEKLSARERLALRAMAMTD
jgi:23S rRNA (adenine2503-C2)-methyltransferase